MKGEIHCSMLLGTMDFRVILCEEAGFYGKGAEASRRVDNRRVGDYIVEDMERGGLS